MLILLMWLNFLWVSTWPCLIIFLLWYHIHFSFCSRVQVKFFLQYRSSYRRCSIKKAVRNIHRKTSVLGSLFNKVAGLQVRNSIKKRLQHRKFLRTSFLKNICERLPLTINLHNVDFNPRSKSVFLLYRHEKTHAQNYE